MHTPVNILMVDDDPRNLDVLESILTAADYRLFRAKTANEALLALINHEFAVLVLDVRMPEISGLELAQLIKQRKKTQHIPIIFLTAYYQEDKDVLEGYGAGAVDYLSKPVNPLILRSKVEVFVDLFRKNQRLAKMNRAMETEIEERIQQLKASLHEKEVLLKEIHHRVKNNLQIISSLLSLQADKIIDTKVLDLFRDARDRVRSMALVHEKLYQSHDLARIELSEYMRDLLTSLLQAYRKGTTTIRLTFNLQPVQLPVDEAIPCGLILNELATNAFKHAFIGQSEGEISTGVHIDNNGRVQIVFRDNGVGFPSHVDYRASDTLGLRLVHMLNEQLHGTFEIGNVDGTEFSLSFQSKGSEVLSMSSTVAPGTKEA